MLHHNHKARHTDHQVRFEVSFKRDIVPSLFHRFLPDNFLARDVDLYEFCYRCRHVYAINEYKRVFSEDKLIATAYQYVPRDLLITAGRLTVPVILYAYLVNADVEKLLHDHLEAGHTPSKEEIAKIIDDLIEVMAVRMYFYLPDHTILRSDVFKIHNLQELESFLTKLHSYHHTSTVCHTKPDLTSPAYGENLPSFLKDFFNYTPPQDILAYYYPYSSPSSHTI